MDQKKTGIVFHGTYNDFNDFDVEKCGLGIHFGTLDAAMDRLEQRENPKEALGRIVPAGLDLQNPLYLISDLGDWSDMEMLKEYLGETNEGPFTDAEFDAFEDSGDVRRGLMAKGYDGIVYCNSFEGKDPDKYSYIVFDSSRITAGNAEPVQKLERMAEVLMQAFPEKTEDLGEGQVYFEASVLSRAGVMDIDSPRNMYNLLVVDGGWEAEAAGKLIRTMQKEGHLVDTWSPPELQWTHVGDNVWEGTTSSYNELQFLIKGNPDPAVSSRSFDLYMKETMEKSTETTIDDYLDSTGSVEEAIEAAQETFENLEIFFADRDRSPAIENEDDSPMRM